ncbi:MAG: MFS transporter [Christensenellaceae bacterium]
MKRNILVLNLAAAFIWMSMYSYVPTLPSYAMTLGANAVMIGVIGGAYGIMQIFLRIPLGILSDKTGKDKLILTIGFVILTISAFMFVFLKSPIWIVIARGVAGAAAAWWVIISASYAKYNSEENQIKAQGVLSASANIGKFVAAALGGVVAQLFGLSAPFIVAVVAAIIGLFAVLQFKTPKDAKKFEPPTAKQLVSLLKNKHLILFSCLAIFSQLLCFALPSMFTAVAAQNIGANSFEMGMLMMVYFLVTGISSLFVGTKLYRKIGGIKTLTIAFIIGAFSCIPMFYTMNMGMIYLMQALSGVCYGISCSALSGFVIKCVHPSQRSTATGIFQSLFAIGIFAGPVLAGALIDYVSFDAAYYAMLAASLLAAILSYTLIPKKYDKMQ